MHKMYFFDLNTADRKTFTIETRYDLYIGNLELDLDLPVKVKCITFNYVALILPA